MNKEYFVAIHKNYKDSDQDAYVLGNKSSETQSYAYFEIVEEVFDRLVRVGEFTENTESEEIYECYWVEEDEVLMAAEARKEKLLKEVECWSYLTRLNSEGVK